jgi:hypothetical protein
MNRMATSQVKWGRDGRKEKAGGAAGWRPRRYNMVHKKGGEKIRGDGEGIFSTYSSIRDSCVTGQVTHDWNPLHLHVESAN